MREIAYKASVKELLSGEFTPSPGEYEPAYVTVGARRINRCNVVGKLVRNEVLDDGTGEITVTRFDGPIDVNEGSVVRVIGKVRERETGRFIAVETIQPVDEKWMELRKLELAQQPEEKVEEKAKEETQEVDIEEIEV